MNKRLMCLLLCLVMVVGCLVGCSQETDEEAIDDVNEAASESAMTLAMYLLCEEKISDTQAQAIETAVNKITKPKFKTQLELYFYTADEYYTKLEASFQARKEAEEAGLIVNKTPDEETKEETFENEWGISEIKYPTIEGYQVDIFYVAGADKLNKYIADGMVSRLDDQLTSASKLLNDYISPEFLTYIKSINSGTYAIPNNAAIGEYKYMLVNKEVLNLTKYNTDAGILALKQGGLTGTAAQSLLAQVKSDYTSYVPLYSCLGENGIVLPNAKYWGVDENGELCGDFSVITTECPDAKYGTEESFMLGSMSNVLLSTTNRNAIKTLKYYKQQGYFGNEKDLEDGKVAVAYMEGGADIAAKYSNKYEAIVIGEPTLETEALYENMFAVTSYSTSVARSMEIITYLNTNEDFRNLLLYGIEGENYELVDSEYVDKNGNAYKVVRRLNNEYIMDVNKTGNTLLAKTLEGGDPTLNEFIKVQNADVKVSLTMGFKLQSSPYVVGPEWLEEVRTLSQTVYQRLQECTYENCDEVLAELTSLINNNESYMNLMMVRGKEAGGDPEGTQVGLTFMYESWGIAMKIYNPNDI